MTEHYYDYQKQSEKYDIVQLDQVIMYKSGDKISPEIDKFINNFFKQYNKLKKEFSKEIGETPSFKEMLKKETKKRFEFLVKYSENKMMFRDKDWVKIFSNIDKSNNDFERYCSLLFIQIPDNRIYNFIRALIVNDDLYNHYQK